jgi:hypothetical protein
MIVQEATDAENFNSAHENWFSAGTAIEFGEAQPPRNITAVSL